MYSLMHRFCLFGPALSPSLSGASHLVVLVAKQLDAHSFSVWAAMVWCGIKAADRTTTMASKLNFISVFPGDGQVYHD
jgi:hypothetical protein